MRPGKRPTGEEAARILRHIRHNWPRTVITVHGDGHYGTLEIMDILTQHGCFYIFGLPGNNRLKMLSHPWSEDVAVRRVLSIKDKVRRFFQFCYAAKSWSKKRKVIARVEATKLSNNTRITVTNLPGRAKHLYKKVYCARGRMENLIKEQKHQIRPHLLPPLVGQPVPAVPAHRCLLVAAAITQNGSKRSRFRTATFETIRRAFLKIAVRVEQLKSRIRIALPTACPQQNMLVLLMQHINAQSPDNTNAANPPNPSRPD